MLSTLSAKLFASTRDHTKGMGDDMKGRLKVVHLWLMGRARVIHKSERVLVLAVGGSVALGIHTVEVFASGGLAVLMAVALFAEEE